MHYYVVTLTNKTKIIVSSGETLSREDLDLYFLGTMKKYVEAPMLEISPSIAQILKGTNGEILKAKEEIKK